MAKRITVRHHVFASGGSEAISLVLAGKGERIGRAEEKIIAHPSHHTKIVRGTEN